ncbi:MAG: UvrB/UvrC motif-containing protein [Candidatus Peribacteria bacterium]|nr:MAG: UvrB/UvrC motif-containing protein [Candidatus Peribacteria bacterium]
MDHIRIQIDEAVSREHFERAARLRDIYTGLNDLIQRQDVVIDLARDGHVRQVQQIGSWRVWVIATFQQGRLVDIIRQRESIEETSLNELLSLLELEYGDPTLIDTAEYKQFVRTHRDVDRDDREGLITFLTQEVGHGIIGITGQTYLTKDYYIAIADVLAKAVDSYIVSTSRES